MAGFDPTHGPFEDGVDAAGVVGDGDEGCLGRLPSVVATYFSGGQVELTAQAGQVRLEDAAFALQRVVAGEV